jgi:hypothetical protein
LADSKQNLKMDILNEFEATNKTSSEGTGNSPLSSCVLEVISVELISGGMKGKINNELIFNEPMFQ